MDKRNYSLFLFLCLSIIICSHGWAQAVSESDATGHIRVIVDIPNTKVYFNGQAEGLSHPDRPLDRPYVPVGPITISVKAEEYPEQSKTIQVISDQITDVAFELLSAPALVEQLLKQGDNYLEKEQFTTPAEENALFFYKEASKIAPENRYVKERILNMMGQIKKIADTAYKNTEYDKAKRLYDEYILVSDHAATIIEEHEILPNIKEIQIRQKELAYINQPVDKIIAEADAHFEGQRYTIPADKNAFILYRSVLKINPGNAHARQRIDMMMEMYKTQGNSAYEQKKLSKAQTAYVQYLFIARYVSDVLKDRDISVDISICENRLREIESSSRNIETLLKEGDSYFIAQRFTTPPEKNAFYFYRQVVDTDSENVNAIEKIREILKFYKTWGDEAFKKKKRKDARKFYEQYLDIGLNIPPGICPEDELQEVQKRLNSLKAVERLIEEGDAYFIGRRYTMPPGENAFEAYQKVLKIEPDEDHAKKKIYEIMNKYKIWAESAQKEKDFDKAEQCYQQYIFIADYVSKTFGDRDVKSSSLAVRKRMKELDELDLREQLAIQRQKLSEKLETYRELKEKEEQNENVAQQIVQVLKELVDRLKEIENLYERFLDKDPSINEMIERAKTTRSGLEKEIEIREKKAF